MNTSIHGMKRTVWCGELRAADAEKEVTVNGWCERTRDNGGVLFLLLRDRTGTIQCTFDKSVNAELFDIAFGVRTEYVLAIRGKVVLRRLYLSPRINAAGRMGHVEIATELFLTNDAARGGPGKPAVQAQPQAAGCGERHLPAGGFNAPGRKGAEGNCPGG